MTIAIEIRGTCEGLVVKLPVCEWGLEGDLSMGIL